MPAPSARIKRKAHILEDDALLRLSKNAALKLLAGHACGACGRPGVPWFQADSTVAGETGPPPVLLSSACTIQDLAFRNAGLAAAPPREPSIDLPVQWQCVDCLLRETLSCIADGHHGSLVAPGARLTCCIPALSSPTPTASSSSWDLRLLLQFLPSSVETVTYYRMVRFIAEGLETEEQRRLFLDNRCEFREVDLVAAAQQLDNTSQHPQQRRSSRHCHQQQARLTEFTAACPSCFAPEGLLLRVKDIRRKTFVACRHCDAAHCACCFRSPTVAFSASRHCRACVGPASRAAAWSRQVLPPVPGCLTAARRDRSPWTPLPHHCMPQHRIQSRIVALERARAANSSAVTRGGAPLTPCPRCGILLQAKSRQWLSHCGVRFRAICGCACMPWDGADSTCSCRHTDDAACIQARWIETLTKSLHER
jgi:hypothetical protein